MFKKMLKSIKKPPFEGGFFVGFESHNETRLFFDQLFTFLIVSTSALFFEAQPLEP